MNRQFDWSKVRTYNFQILQQALYYDAPWRQIDHLHQTLAQSYMDQIQATLDGLKENENLDLRRKCIKCLRGLSQCYSILPSSFYVSVSSGLLSKEDRAVGGGGFSDVYRGTYKAQPVALKVLRIHEHGQFNETNVIKAFCQEVLTWQQLRHANIQPFLGASADLFRSQLCLISPWLPYGNVMMFLRHFPHWHRVSLLFDVASGMQYLHSLYPPIVHADIRGANILVDQSGRCRLTDFGISLYIETQIPGTHTLGRGNHRWHPPELVFDPTKFNHLEMPSLDVYSFGCTVIEMYTGEPPYGNIPDGEVMKKIFFHQLPDKPAAHVLPTWLWNYVVLPCLSHLASSRPTPEVILDRLEQLETTRHGLRRDTAWEARVGAENARLYREASQRLESLIRERARGRLDYHKKGTVSSPPQL